jgi:hypothetical protein
MARRWVRRVIVLGAVAIAVAVLVRIDSRGRPEDAGEMSEARIPPARLEAGDGARHALGPEAKQILFGDLHVHTTFSVDAFAWSLPIMQGEGVHPPADACDFARFCSGLDFWALTDHAEALTPRHWRMTKESVRRCNAVAGDPASPDLVTFLGFEWTQMGDTPATHYGHKNVIFRDTAEARVPARPIAAGGVAGRGMRQPRTFAQRYLLPYLRPRERRPYQDLDYKMTELAGQPLCPAGVDVRELPADCVELAATPRELFEKLAQWGFEALVIPHGTTWGFYTPPGSTLDKQLTRAQHDPERQTLFEVFSGHGNSEEYRDWRAAVWDATGEPTCPAPAGAYVPCCRVAGELVRARCGPVATDECERRVREAERNFLRAGRGGRHTLPWATVDDWKDCDQCPDCFNPALSYRPGGAAQYALAIANFDDPAAPLRFRFGFLASSDNHSARPGTGYKELARVGMTDARSIEDGFAHYFRTTGGGEPGDESVPFDLATTTLNFLQVADSERQASFFLTGGLAAVHAAGRDRAAVWEALERREVYGTSGDRILLWFDLLNAPGGPVPMGSEVALDAAPRFRVRAVGALEQLPGCAEYAVAALGAARLDALCRGECHHPGEARRRIARIEVVRVRPQVMPGEPVRPLIEDPWRVLPCAPDPAGCAVELDDPDFPAAGREHVYYARAIQEPTPAVNAGGLRCERDATGRCVRVRPCFGDERTPAGDDCLAPNEERAWSSPIYVGPAGAGR